MPSDTSPFRLDARVCLVTGATYDVTAGDVAAGDVTAGDSAHDAT